MNIAKKLIAILLIITIFIPVNTAYAHDAVFIQSLINTTNYTYVGIPILDRNGRFSRESNHAEAQLGNFDSFRGRSNTRGFNVRGIESTRASTGSGSNMILSFPGDSSAGNATGQDFRNAERVANLLYPSLNAAISFINENKPITSATELANITHNLLEGNVVGFTVLYGQRATNENRRMRLPNGVNPADVVTIRKTGTNEEVEFIFRTQKSPEENTFITWGHISQQALTAYFHHGFTLATSADQVQPNVLTRFIMGAFEWMISGIATILGLHTLDELVLNSGLRDVTHHYGVYPRAWQRNMSMFYGLFQIFAYLILIFAMIKIFLEKNLSTINTSMRVSLMNNLKNLLIAGMMLPFASIFINNIILRPAYLLTNVFVNMGAGTIDGAYIGMGGSVNNFGMLIIMLAYLFILIYLNIVYIVRAITIALLITTAPIFIASIAINSDYGLFKGYIKELLGNSLIQIIHALTISFFTTVGTGGRTIETLVILYSLIPITKLFKSLIVKSSDTAETLGGQFTGAAVGLTAGAFGGMLAGNKFRNIGKGASENSASTQGAGGTFKSSDSFSGEFNPDTDFSQMTAHDTKRAMDFKEVDPNLKDKSIADVKGGDYLRPDDHGTAHWNNSTFATPQKEGTKKKLQNRLEDMKSLRENDKAPNKALSGIGTMLKGAGSAMTGATMIAAGAGLMIATGSASSGGTLLAKAGGVVMGGGGLQMKEGYKGVRQHIAENKTNINTDKFQDRDNYAMPVELGERALAKAKEGVTTADIPMPDFDQRSEYQNLLGAELLDSGNVVVARDLDGIKAEGEGLRDVIQNSDGTTGLVQDIMLDYEAFQNGEIQPTIFSQRIDNDSMHEYQQIAELYNRGDMEALKEHYGIESITAVRGIRKNAHDIADYRNFTKADRFDIYEKKFPGAIGINKDNGAVDGMFMKINYNKDGLRKLGVTDIKKHNGKIFEYKKADDPFATKKVHVTGLDLIGQAQNNNHKPQVNPPTKNSGDSLGFDPKDAML